MSRADLARKSGLTRVTVSDLVTKLTADGTVEERGPREGTHVGKPATLIDIRTDTFHIIALDLSADDRFVGGVINLRGTILNRAEVAIDGKSGDAALTLVTALCTTLTEAAAVRILGIGIDTPGIVDDDGSCARPQPRLVPPDLARHISAVCGAPVYVGNDANTAALGVHTFREASDRSIMMVGTIEHGGGAGLIIGGALVQGEQFAAGEIGHVVVDEDGARCVCGRRGCLELSVAAPTSGSASVPRVAPPWSVTLVAPWASLSRRSSAHSTSTKSCYPGRPRSLRARCWTLHPHAIGRQQRTPDAHDHGRRGPRAARRRGPRPLRRTGGCPECSYTTSITSGALPSRWKGRTRAPFIQV